jgi:hypothetical protein
MKSSIRRAAAGAALVATAVTGGAVGASLLGNASAQTSGGSSTTVPAANGAGGGQFDPTQGGHVGQNGVKEELLTDDTADKVRAAAQAAVPGGTIQRVETDAEGSPYEAHMTKSDGSHVTVKVDKDFKVTSVDNDGTGPGGPRQSGGAPPTTTA